MLGFILRLLFGKAQRKIIPTQKKFKSPSSFVSSKNSAQMQYENKQKGERYELQIGKWYQKQGYKVYFKGINEGRRDGGIDLIAYRGQEAILIQCKNWENTQVKQEHLRIFMGDCTAYLEQNEFKFRKKNVRRAFVTSCKFQEYAVKKFVASNKIEYVVIPYNENQREMMIREKA